MTMNFEHARKMFVMCENYEFDAREPAIVRIEIPPVASHTEGNKFYYTVIGVRIHRLILMCGSKFFVGMVHLAESDSVCGQCAICLSSTIPATEFRCRYFIPTTGVTKSPLPQSEPQIIGLNQLQYGYFR